MMTMGWLGRMLCSQTWMLTRAMRRFHSFS
jgi:hypothetical protein